MRLAGLKIHIIGGTGAMGNWLKNFIVGQGLNVEVSGRKGNLEELISDVDIVFVSVPISVSAEVIRKVGNFAREDCLVIDLSSVMGFAEKELKKLKNPSGCLHLLFGPTVSSITHQQVVLSRIKNSKLLDELKQLLDENGAVVSEMTPKEHDRQMAYIQGLTHFVNLSLAKTLIDNKIDTKGKVSTPVFLAQLSAISRVISQPPSLLSEIQINNPQYKKVLDGYLKTQNGLKKLVINKDLERINKDIEKIYKSLESSKSVDVKKIKSVLTPRLKTNLKIGYLGPKGTFSHQAALQIAKNGDRQLVSLETIYHIFEAVQSGRVELGIVPAENSTEGTVRETLDYLIDFDLRTNASLDLVIHQNLLSGGRDIKTIKRVMSHPQGLAQCREWLNQNLTKASRENTKSTLSAVEEHREDSNVAIIGSELAAKMYGLNILSRNIEDNKNNVTKFYIISKDLDTIGVETKKTLLFLTAFNRVGVLRDILDVFVKFDINLSRLESRPSREKVWDYHFFIEVEAGMREERLVEALNIMKQYCPMIKVLGGV